MPWERKLRCGQGQWCLKKLLNRFTISIHNCIQIYCLVHVNLWDITYCITTIIIPRFII